MYDLQYGVILLNADILLQRAIQLVSVAIEEDNKQNYAEAYKQYSNALDYFMLALKCARFSNIKSSMYLRLTVGEKNEKSKQLIRGKIEEYIARAETLKNHITDQEDKRAKKAVGANGTTNGGTGGKGLKCAPSTSLGVVCLSDVHCALTGKVMTMTPIQRSRSCAQVSRALSLQTSRT